MHTVNSYLYSSKGLFGLKVRPNDPKAKTAVDLMELENFKPSNFTKDLSIKRSVELHMSGHKISAEEYRCNVREAGKKFLGRTGEYVTSESERKTKHHKCSESYRKRSISFSTGNVNRSECCPNGCVERRRGSYHASYDPMNTVVKDNNRRKSRQESLLQKVSNTQNCTFKESFVT